MADRPITDTSVIEQIRQAMPVASITDKGLSPAKFVKSTIYLVPGQVIELNVGYGFWILANSSLGSEICFMHVVADLLLIAERNSIYSLGVETPNKVCIIVATEYQLKIKNNMSQSLSIAYVVISPF